MIFADIKNIQDLPGIYCIENTVNNKRYIGLSLFIRRRLRQHYSAAIKGNMDSPLYRAMKKYGIDVFDITILEQFYTNDYTGIKTKLDDLEREYIKKYNTYENGYNQTLGGDGGVLGYKFTDAQKYAVKVDARYTPGKHVYIYDCNTGSIIHAISIAAAANILGDYKMRTQLSKHLDKCVVYRQYIICSSQHLLTAEYIESAKHAARNTGGRKYTLDEYYKKLKEIQSSEYLPAIEKITKALGICKKTVCTYNNQLKETGKIISVGYHKNILK